VAEILTIVVSWVITMPSIAFVLWLDDLYMTPEQRAGAWPPASRLLAIGYSLLVGPLPGVLVLPIHFGRTRIGSPLGFILWLVVGLLLAALILALDVGAAYLVDIAFGADS
jgi:hypothetical protein